jgi:voltage-gated potassium channel Kch
VALVSVGVLRLGYLKADGSHMTVLDAVYFTVETIGTVGYGDFSFAEQASRLRTYAIALMLAGLLLAPILFALLTDLLVSARLAHSFGRRRAATMRGHVLVVGLGAIGLRVVRELMAAGNRVVVLERDPDNRHLGLARALGVPVVIGDATDAGVLAGVNLAARPPSPCSPATTWSTSRPGWPRATSSATGGPTSRWCCGCSTASSATRSAAGWTSVTSARPRRWSPRGSSAPR